MYKTLKLFSIILLAIITFSCGKTEKDPSGLFSLQTSNKKSQYPLGSAVKLVVNNTQNLEIGPIHFYVNDEKIDGNTLTLSNIKLGSKLIKAAFKYNDKLIVLKTSIEVLNNTPFKELKFEVVNTYPHDIGAYTQGLEFYKGELYESTGQYGKSSLRKVDYKTGTVEKNLKLSDKIFGEGLTVYNDKIYQLTWKSRIGFVYNPETFEQERTFRYFKSLQGWGLCNNGKKLYKSDGTPKIWTLNPDTLEEEDYIEIYTNNSQIKSVNELEWINGRIFANIYQKNGIAIINPTNGAVEGVLDCTELKNQVTQHDQLDVLNGIAYNPETQTIFVTGKNWDKLFEIKISE